MYTYFRHACVKFRAHALTNCVRGREFSLHEVTLLSAASCKKADLILLDADPLADIAHVSRISALVLRGRLFERAALTHLVDEVSGAPDVAVNDWPRTPAR